MTRLNHEETPVRGAIGVEPAPITCDISYCACEIEEGEEFTIGSKSHRLCANECRERSEDPSLLSGNSRLGLAYGIPKINHL
jgi:hypothetical protein